MIEHTESLGEIDLYCQLEQHFFFRLCLFVHLLLCTPIDASARLPERLKDPICRNYEKQTLGGQTHRKQIGDPCVGMFFRTNFRTTARLGFYWKGLLGFTMGSVCAVGPNSWKDLIRGLLR